MLSDNESLKSKLGFINSVLVIFCLRINIVKKHIIDKFISYYKLDHLYNICEIIENKINKGYNINFYLSQ